jgi:hypothetical protein
MTTNFEFKKSIELLKYTEMKVNIMFKQKNKIIFICKDL